MLEKLIADIAHAGGTVLDAITPAALGSLVAQAYQKGLSWRDRFVQWIVGILVSYYVARAVVAWLDLGQFAGQAVGFVLGMIAFQAAPKFISSASDIAGKVPGWLADRAGVKRDAGE